ncbi:MAG: NAD(P)/FAD-dependent oxidoreductase [Flavobacteriales bacterium]|nr:NAD(P)/FAD-dependent oxidoreductase [Flavobacteriales bacterium]
MLKRSTRNPQFKDHYDVVIIGAGASGLTSAALLSRMGYSVCVLEMDSRPGGYLAGFRRKDFRFDSAIHWLNQCGPGGMITKIFGLIANDYPRTEEQKLIRRYKGESFDYLLTNQPDDFRDQLIKDFPHEEKGIRKFFRDARRVAVPFKNYDPVFRTMETMSLWEKSLIGLRMLTFVMPFLHFLRYTGDAGVRKGLKRYFKDEKLMDIFCSEMDFMSIIVPIAWAYNNDYQLPPPGGSQVFPEWLEHVTMECGNDLFFKCKVTSIECEEKVAKSVIVEHRDEEYRVKTDFVIAACDSNALFTKMLPQELVKKEFVQKLDDAELYSSSVTISLALDKPAEHFGFGEEMVFFSRDDVKREEHSNGDPYTSGIIVLAPSARDRSLAPDGMGTLTLYTSAFFDYEDQWRCEVDEKGNLIRGEAYKQLKEEYADIVIRRIEERMNTDIRGHIVYCDIATPITHWRYTGNHQGTMMGARPGKENIKSGVARYSTPVKNVLLSGHWAELGGGVPIAVKTATNAVLLYLQRIKNTKAAKGLARYMEGRTTIPETRETMGFGSYTESYKPDLTPADKKRLDVAE